jgi:L-aspartate oxidase
MPAVHDDAELAPRDVVARAVEHEHERTGRVVLDVSMFDFADTFPDLVALCDEHGVDPSPGIPVVPAEHFLCGGVDVDTRGRASLDRLYAVGECARTGVHGANRLASTSLLEGLVWGLRAGEDAAGCAPLTTAPSPEPVEVTPSTSEEALRDAAGRLQRTMDRHAGLRRTRDGLRHALDMLGSLQADIDAQTDLHARRFLHELRSACTVARLIVEAAAANETSVGCHYMEEEPQAETGPR